MIQHIYSLFLEYPSISTDTRKIEKNSLFFALKGGNFNGNEFAEQALNLGAKYAIIDEELHKKDERYILVKDVLSTLQELASHHRRTLNIPIIAITGSNGKTTTKELIACVLKKKHNIYATLGNLNNHIGVPLTLLALNKEIEIGIVEMGANHQKEIEMLCEIAEPNYGLITNIGKAHLEGFGGVEGIKKGKGELFTFLKNNKGIAFVNSDSEVLLQMAGELTKMTYGTQNNSTKQGKLISSEQTVVFSYWSDNNTETIIHSNLIGDYNIANLLAACSIGEYFGVNQNDIKSAIEEYIPTNNRSQIVKLSDKTLILDAYNANPSSIEAAILNFSTMDLQNKIVVLGDMLELGEESKAEHQKIIHLLESKNYEKVYLVGKLFNDTQSHYNKYENADLLIESLKGINLESTSILIKGSRGIKLEKVADYLQTKKGA